MNDPVPMTADIACKGTRRVFVSGLPNGAIATYDGIPIPPEGLVIDVTPSEHA